MIATFNPQTSADRKNYRDVTTPDVPAGQGAVAFNRKIIDIAQRNVNSGFDLAKSLAGAKNLSEIVELQADYWQKLLGALTSQAEEVRALSTKTAAAAGEPLKEQMKRGVDDLRKSN